MFPTDSFDFSGNYAFVTNQWSMHRLDESVRPLLEARGGRIWRINTGHGRAEALSGRDFSHRSLPPNFWESHAVRAVFTIDNYVPPDVVPPHIPLIALPHAFWTDPAGQLESLGHCPFYLGNADYYLAQNRAASVTWEIASFRRRDQVTVLPLGSLKMDELRRRCTAESGNCLMYCRGTTAHEASPESGLAFVEACLRHFPERILYVRPFPGERDKYDGWVRRFRSSGNFRLDGSRSLLRHLPEAAALICDDSSTVGMLYSLATGRRAVYLPAHSPHGPGVRQTAFPAVGSPEEMIRELEARLAGDGEEADLVRLRERLVHRPGHARELFLSYLARILSGAELPEALAVPCEYVGDRQFASPREAIAFFLRVLRNGRVEQYQTFLGLRSGIGLRLAGLYTQLLQRLRNGQPVILLLRGRTCRVQEEGEAEPSCPIYCPSPPEAYRPATRDFLRERRALLRDAPEAGAGEMRILLPDGDKQAFCLALADQVERMFGPA